MRCGKINEGNCDDLLVDANEGPGCGFIRSFAEPELVSLEDGTDTSQIYMTDIKDGVLEAHIDTVPSYMSQGIVHGADVPYSILCGIERLKALLSLEGKINLKSLKFSELTYGGYVMRLSLKPLDKTKKDTISGVFSIGDKSVYVGVSPSGAPFVENNNLMVNEPETYMSYGARQKDVPIIFKAKDRSWELEIDPIPEDMPTPREEMTISTVLELVNTVVSAHIDSVSYSPFGKVVAAVRYNDVPAIPAKILFRDVTAVRMVIEKVVTRGEARFVYTTNSLKLSSGEVIECGKAVGCSSPDFEQT